MAPFPGQIWHNSWFASINFQLYFMFNLCFYQSQMFLTQSNLLSPDAQQLGQKSIRGLGDGTQGGVAPAFLWREQKIHLSSHPLGILTAAAQRLDGRWHVRVFCRGANHQNSAFTAYSFFKMCSKLELLGINNIGVMSSILVCVVFVNSFALKVLLMRPHHLLCWQHALTQQNMGQKIKRQSKQTRKTN